MIHACYGSGCPFERPDGECKKSGWVSKCPVDMTEEEAEDAMADEEYYRELYYESKQER